MFQPLRTLLLALFVLPLFVACNTNDDDAPPVDEGQIPQNCGVNTGRLRIVLKRWDPGCSCFQSANGSELYFYATYQDYQNNLYLQTRLYNLGLEGVLDTGCWNWGTYYVLGQVNVGGIWHRGVEPVQVQEAFDYTHVIELYPQ
jgi:hypothetical protein